MNVISIVEFIEAAAAAFAALRLFHLGLFRAQSALSAFLLVNALFLFALAFLSPRSNRYFAVYLSGTVIGWILSVAAVRQVFALVLRSYPGIRTAARWTMYAALTAAIAVSMGVSGAAWRQGPAGHSAILFYTESVNRSVVLTLAVFIALFLMLMSRYPLHLQRNTIISCGFFGAMFISEALSTLVDTLSPRLYSVKVDAFHVGISAACLFLWGLLLRKSTPSKPDVTIRRPDEDRLLRELESINEMLSRAARK